MPEVIVRKGEPIDRALKRLKSKLDAEGIMDEVRRLRAFETPTQKSKRKAKANAKRAKAKFRFNARLVVSRASRRAVSFQFSKQPVLDPGWLFCFARITRYDSHSQTTRKPTSFEE